MAGTFEAQQIQEMLRTRRHVRVGPHTAAYVAGKLSALKGAARIPVFAADARTGVPRPIDLAPGDLDEAPSQMSLFH